MWLIKTKRSPYWQARWNHPDGESGVVSQSTREEGKRAAEARGLELEAEFRKQWERDRAGGSVPSSKVIEEFWDTDASTKKAALDHVFPHLERIAKFLGDRPYCDVTVADVARFADQLSGVVSPSTVNRALSVWRRMHNVAGKRRLYPVQMIDWSQVRRDEPVPQSRYLKEAEVRALLDRMPEHAQEIAIFAVLTGARRSQVLTLTWDRVNLQEGWATVWRKHRKNQAPHRIELSPSAVDIVARRAQAATGDLVFNTTNFRRHWDHAVKTSGIGDVRFHDLRHTMASYLARKAPLPVVQRQLGHSDIRVTMRYAHVQPEDVRIGIMQLPAISLSSRVTNSDTDADAEQAVLKKINENNDKTS